MIGIGALYGGPEHEGSPIDLLVSATMQAADDVCGEWESMTTPRVNVNFCVPGSVSAYEDITRIDVGTISRKQRAVVVRVPVPRDVAKAGGSAQFIADSLLEASRLAADVFARKGIDGFDLAKAAEAVEQIKHLVEEKLRSERASTFLASGAVPSKSLAPEAGRRATDLESLDKPSEKALLNLPIIKLYKRAGNGWLYWEAWESGERTVTAHWGTLGDNGCTKQIVVPSGSTSDDVISRESQKPRLEGYEEKPIDELVQIVVQFRTKDPSGGEADLEKCHKVEHILNDRLGWTGNGHCDGGDIGSGTINAFSCVLDPYIAKETIVAGLQKGNLLRGAIIAIQTEDDYEVVWPDDFCDRFSII